MRKAILWLCLGLTPGSSQQPPSVQAGGVTGKVVGDDGIALAGTKVVFSPVQVVMSKRTGPAENRRFGVSGPDGNFQLEGLGTGSYMVCAKAPRSPWLGSCDWGSKPAIAVVSAGPHQHMTIVLKKGAIIPIRLEDPRGALAQNLGKTRGAHLLLGVGGADGLFRPLAVSGEGSGFRGYQALVPFDHSVRVVLSSSFFQLADELGTPLQRTISIPIKVPAGQASPAVRVIVTGARTP